MKRRIITIAGTLLLPGILLSIIWLFGANSVIRAGSFDVCASCTYTTINAAVTDFVNVLDGSTINVGPGIYTETVVLTRSMTIQGQGIDVTIIDGDNSGSVFEISDDSAVTVTIKDITIQNGSSADGGGGVYNNGVLTIINSVIKDNDGQCDDGGGILNFSSLTLQDVVITGNSAASGGGIVNEDVLIANNITVTLNTANDSGCGSWVATGGGIDNSGTAIIANSVVSTNTAVLDGGGIENDRVITISLSTISNNTTQEDGGGVDNAIAGTMLVMSNTIRNNNAVSGGGFNNEGVLTLTASTINGNKAQGGNGGGVRNLNGGAFTAVNSTISGNSASESGGIHNEGVGATAVLRSSTIYNNSGFFSSGINNMTGTVTLSNTIVIHLSSSAACYGSGIISDGSNLDSDGSCGLGAGELSNVTDPKLGPLQDNGGPTWTHALLLASPAIDAATGCETTDQRGVARPVGNTCDIGAYETTQYDVYLPVVIK